MGLSAGWLIQAELNDKPYYYKISTAANELSQPVKTPT